MDSQEENTTACASGSSEKAPTRPLHDCACFFISLTHTVLERLTHVPYPIGTIIQCVETKVDRWTHPLTHSLECHGLYILAAMDDKISALGSFAGGCIFCAATQLKMVVLPLYTKGIIGTSAGLWLKYEAMVTEDIQKAVRIASKVPLVNLVTPFVCAVSSPLARTISDWLLKQGARVENGTHTIESLNTELEAPSTCIDVGSTMINMIVDDVHCGGQVASADDFVEEEGKFARMDDFVKHNLHLSEQDMSVDDGETHAMSVRDIVEDNKDLASASLDDVNVEEGAMAAVTTIERPHLSTQEGDDYVPNVLEMIESRWLLGKFSFP